MFVRYFAVIVALVVAISCKKKEESPHPTTLTPSPSTPTTRVAKYGKAVLHLHTFVGDEELEAYVDDVALGDRRISMSLGYVYLSDFELVDMNGFITPLPDTVILKVQDNISYNLNKIPVGRYKSIRFKVGLDSVASHKPVNSAFGGILNKPDMWFESIADPNKFVFAHFKGKIDTATTPDASNERADYHYKIGTKAHFIQVVMPIRAAGTEFNIGETGSEYFHIYMDLLKLFEGISLNNPSNLQVTSVVDNSTSIANKLATNISNMFRYE
jgi:hypothetical protein